jgi:O-antigen/teichoic acid export membrane protein
MSAAAGRPLRSHGVKSGFAVGLASRGVRFLTNLVLARAIILKFGPGMWGILALCWSVCDLIVILDFAIHELCVYEGAAAPSRESAQHSFDQALLMSVLPAGLGTLALLACAGAAARGIGFGADYAGPALTQLFLAAAAGYVFTMVSRVYTGSLQGLGWIRELNLFALTSIVIDFAVVVGGLSAGLGIVGIGWARAALAPVGLLLLLGTVRHLGLPLARPRPPDRAILRRMLHYAIRYNVNRGLGSAVANCSAPIAQRFVPAAQLGGFGAADQWAGKLRKFSEVVWESLFHRLVRCFRMGASAQEREDGRLQFLAASLGMSLFLVPAGVILILVSPWLFRFWLDAEKAMLPLALLPGLVAAWCLNSTASPASCAILASNRFGLSARIHAAVLAVNVALTIALTRLHGIAGAVEAMVISNVLLTTLLSLSACRLTGASWWRWLRSNSLPYVVGILVLFWNARSGSPASMALAIVLSVGASAAVGFKARSFRSFREILRDSDSAA